MKSIPVFLSLLILTALPLAVGIQEAAPAEATGQSVMERTGDVGPGMDMMSAQAGMCGPGCSCKKDGMACKKEGMGMMGMRGGMDMMTRPAMNKLCRTPEFFLMHKDDLGLSPYQVEATYKLYISLKKEMLTKGAAVMVLELELGEIVTKADFKLSDAEDKLKEIEKARTDLRMAVLKASSDARDVLGPEQLEKLKELNISLLVPGGRCAAPPAGAMKDMKEMMKEKMRQKMTQ